jgi:probable poly-beta-1,6-N-acetyl-D-glucosamine export protein
MLWQSSSVAMPASSRRGLPYLADVHSFRAFAITAVVATHVTDYLEWGESSTLAKNLALSVFQNGSVMFVFIAGLLFQYLSAGFDYRRYSSSKVRFVFVPYLFASLPTLAHQYARKVGIFAPSVYHGHWLRTVSVALLRAGHLPRPFWFIPMIGLFYLAAPAFLWLDRKARSYLFVLPVSLVVAGFAHRPFPLSQPLHAFVYFFPAYVAGMAAGRFHSTLVVWLKLGWVRWGLSGLAAAMVLVEVFALGRGGAVWSKTLFETPLSFDINHLMKLVFTLAALSWLGRAKETVHLRLYRLAELSFGVFFVHEYVLFGLNRVLGPFTGTIWFILVGALVTTTISLGIVLLIKRVAGARSRYLVGC